MRFIFAVLITISYSYVLMTTKMEMSSPNFTVTKYVTTSRKILLRSQKQLNIIYRDKKPRIKNKHITTHKIKANEKRPQKTT